MRSLGSCLAHAPLIAPGGGSGLPLPLPAASPTPMSGNGSVRCTAQVGKGKSRTAWVHGGKDPSGNAVQRGTVCLLHEPARPCFPYPVSFCIPGSPARPIPDFLNRTPCIYSSRSPPVQLKSGLPPRCCTCTAGGCLWLSVCSVSGREETKGNFCDVTAGQRSHKQETHDCQ